jgi:hypothetical protein
LHGKDLIAPHVHGENQHITECILPDVIACNSCSTRWIKIEIQNKGSVMFIKKPK